MIKTKAKVLSQMPLILEQDDVNTKFLFLLLFFYPHKRTNKQIGEDYKNGIAHSEFSVFICKELDKYIVRRIPIDAEEREKVLRDFKEEGLPPEGYTIAIQNSGAIIKRKLEKRDENGGNNGISDQIIVKAEVTVNKSKKEFKDDVL
jgi:hypothetical protein